MTIIDEMLTQNTSISLTTSGGVSQTIIDNIASIETTNIANTTAIQNLESVLLQSGIDISTAVTVINIADYTTVEWSNELAAALTNSISTLSNHSESIAELQNAVLAT